MLSELICFILMLNYTATTDLYPYLHTLSLHVALPISLYKGQPSLLANCYHRPTAYRTHILAAIDLDGIPAPVSAVSGAVAISASASDRKSTRLNSSH